MYARPARSGHRSDTGVSKHRGPAKDAALIVVLVLCTFLIFTGCARRANTQAEPTPATHTPSVVANPPTTMPRADVEMRTFEIIPEESEARYEVRQSLAFRGIDLTTTVGTTSAIEGRIRFSLEDNRLVLGPSSFEVDLRTLVSDDEKRDSRIREQWLESNVFPLARFTATRIEDLRAVEGTENAWRFSLVGDMTVRDSTRVVTYDVNATLADGVLEGQAIAEMLMTDFGFDPPSSFGFFNVENSFRVVINLTAREVR